MALQFCWAKKIEKLKSKTQMAGLILEIHTQNFNKKLSIADSEYGPSLNSTLFEINSISNYTT